MSQSASEQIKLQFRINKTETAKPTIAVMIHEGEEQLERMNNLYRTRLKQENGVQESWKGSVDPEGTDERGRVGKGFPWER